MLQQTNPAIGRDIDDYRILETLGRGGMGIVYLAEDLGLSKKVALKIIDPMLAQDETFLRKFRSEGRALASIDSPYIVKVHALRHSSAGSYMVMEYVDGGTIGDLGKISVEKALPIIKQMLTALEHAHSVGVIHRDIKPSNIMLTRSGTVKVTDFGLAKLTQTTGASTITQGVAGTLYYMSPEQVKAHRDLDHRSDLYSMGMTIYEMLTGQVPFDKTSSEYAIMKVITEGKIPSPAKFNPDLPADVTKIITKSLEKDPSRRYQNAAEMRAAFEEVEQTLHPSSSVSRNGQVSVKSSRMPVVIISVLAALLLVGTGGYFAYKKLISGGSETDQTKGDSFYRIVVSSNPPGAIIEVNGETMGRTPTDTLDFKVRALRLKAELFGYKLVDTTINVQMGGIAAINLPLKAEEKTVENTDSRQLSNNDNKGSTSDGSSQQGGNLDNDSRRDLNVARAVFSLSIPVGATMKIDNGPPLSSGEVSVNAGTRKVSCTVNSITTEKQFTLKSGDRRNVACYSSHKVILRISAVDGQPPVWMSVYLNGSQEPLSGAQAPGTIPGGLSVGKHTVQVGRYGYETVSSPYQISVKPSFEQRTDTLTFKVRKQ